MNIHWAVNCTLCVTGLVTLTSLPELGYACLAGSLIYTSILCFYILIGVLSPKDNP